MRCTKNSRMKKFFGWNHWFWITFRLVFMSLQQQQSVQALPTQFSSVETISTSLKSVLVENDNSFQQTNNDLKIVTGSKSVPIFFKTPDSDYLHDGVNELYANKVAGWLVKPSTKNESNINNLKKKATGESISTNQSISKASTLSNVNSTNSSNTTQIMTATIDTLLTSVITTEPNVIIPSSIMATTTQTTKLIRVHEPASTTPIDIQYNKQQHFFSLKSLSFSNDVGETNQNDLNDTVEIVMTGNESKATGISEIFERKSKELLSLNEEGKIVYNISSRSALQVGATTNNDDRLSSEALFDTDIDNGGIKMNAGIISIICVGIIVSLSAFSVMFVYVYRRRFLSNPPQVLSEPDSSGYIDDSIRENSDELYSLDNDSFLNSLEAMTIQNYWTDNVKHTKL